MASKSNYRPGDNQQAYSREASRAFGAGPVLVAVAPSFKGMRAVSSEPAWVPSLRSPIGAGYLEWKTTCGIKQASDRARLEFIHIGGIARPTALVRNFRPLMPGPP